MTLYVGVNFHSDFFAFSAAADHVRPTPLLRSITTSIHHYQLVYDNENLMSGNYTEMLLIILDRDSTLIQPASKWMHWATLWRHSDLFWTVTSASSQEISILDKSLLTVLLQFARIRPGPLLNLGTSQCNACRGMRWWSIRITCPSKRSLLSLSMSSMLYCPVLILTSSFVTLSFQEMPKMLLFHLNNYYLLNFHQILVNIKMKQYSVHYYFAVRKFDRQFWAFRHLFPTAQFPFIYEVYFAKTYILFIIYCRSHTNVTQVVR